LWALHVILIGWLVNRIDVLHLAIGQYFLTGLFSVTAGIVFRTETLSAFSGALWANI
jgi:EamA domain-containing membrane protein RarD